MRNLYMHSRNLFVVFCLFFIGITGYCQETGVHVAKRIISESEPTRHIPQSSIDSFCVGIADIESASSVRVTYSQMSDWRKGMFRQSVAEWITQYPSEECYQTETILKGHNIQFLSTIVQLYLIPPLEIDPAVAHEAFEQLTEIENIIREDINKKYFIVSDTLSKKYPILGDDFSLGAIADIFFLNYAPPLEDDINYKLKYPLDTKCFDNIKKRINNVIENIKFDLPVISEEEISRLSRLKSEGKIEESNRRVRILTDNLTNAIQFRFLVSIQSQCGNLIYQAYGDVIPKKLLDNYRRFGSDIERLIDMSIINTAAEERKRIGLEQMRRWHEERKAQWDMIVAMQPHREPEPVYEIPEINRPKIWFILLGNLVFIVLFYILYLISKRRRS